MNQIILSANEDKTYIDFWKPVSYAYKKMFPGVTVHLALLTDREEDDPFVTDLSEHGKVTLFKKLPNITEFAQAKMIRFILSSQQGNDVCYIDDIDLFPLSKSFITNKIDKRPAGVLLCVGGEVYQNSGTYPISQITGEGWLFKKFINPFDLELKDLFETWRGDIMFDRRESIDIVLDWAKDDYFSDERLLRKLIAKYPVKKFELKRGYVDYMESTIDRAGWFVDLDKLKNHGYLNAHGIRPYSEHVEKYIPLMDYINDNY